MVLVNWVILIAGVVGLLVAGYGLVALVSSNERYRVCAEAGTAMRGEAASAAKMADGTPVQIMTHAWGPDLYSQGEAVISPGGAEAAITPIGYAGFCSMKAMSTSVPGLSGRCVP